VPLGWNLSRRSLLCKATGRSRSCSIPSIDQLESAVYKCTYLFSTSNLHLLLHYTVCRLKLLPLQQLKKVMSGPSFLPRPKTPERRTATPILMHTTARNALAAADIPPRSSTETSSAGSTTPTRHVCQKTNQEFSEPDASG
jgi:hypothetical protein